MWGVRIEGHAVRMRPIAEAEVPLLLDWSGDPKTLRPAGVGNHEIPPGALEKWWNAAGTDPDSRHWGLECDGRLAGRAAIHGIDWQSRTAWIAVMIGDRPVDRQEVATEGVALLTECAFRQLNLHKLTSSCIDGNRAAAEALLRAGYQEVTRLREQLYRDGRWFDEVLSEVLRDEWERAHPLGIGPR